MKANELSINETNFDEVTNSEASRWHHLFQQKDYNQAKETCDNLIDQMKVVLNNRVWGQATDEDYNKVLVSTLMFKAFKDFTEIGEIASIKNWENENEKIELLWLKHWDCRERLEFSIPNIESPIIDWIVKNLDRLLKSYRKAYGNGLYASPEILIKKEECSICGLDMRACEHLKGYGYNGKICRGIAKDFELKTVSLVTVPKDPRCRVWPWRMKDDRTFGTTVMTLSQIDDFIRE